jgi:hypothetical protein
VSTKPQINRELVALRGGYPNLFTEKGEQWDRRVDAYFLKLRRFDIDLVAKACERAPDKYPDTKFPTSGQLVQLCVAISKEEAKQAREDSDARARKIENENTRQYVMDRREHVIPDHRDDQARWCAETDCPFEALARKWECESKNSNYDPNRPSPTGIGERRMAELMAQMSKDTGLEFTRIGKDRPREREPGEEG